MEFIDIILNIDQYLSVFISKYGVWVYLVLFLVIFAETGLVVTPFLPGDSLLFIVGAVAATGAMKIGIVIPLLLTAAILGNMTNYQIGHFIGPKIFKNKIRFLNEKNLQKTNDFYKKHGGKAIIISRFLPIFRTFVPFIAGIGRMNYLKFFGFNLIGGTAWVLLFTLAGYFFGNIPLIKHNFELVVVGILVISVVPSVIEYLKYKKQEKNN